MKKITYKLMALLLSAIVFADNGGQAPVIQNAMNIEQIQKLTPVNPIGSFGYSVSVSRWGTLAIGSPSENRVYVYEYDVNLGSYYLQATIEPSDGAAGDKFGCSVATIGSSVAIGSYAHNDTGALYVYKTTTSWAEDFELDEKFVGSDSLSGDAFAYSVDYDYATIVVGAPSHNDNRGAVYTIYRSGEGWSQTAKSEIVDGVSDDRFGSSVAIDYLNNKFVVGAPGANNAYLFTGSDEWSVIAKSATLSASDSVSGDRFGDSVDIADSAIVVGASDFSTYAYKAGQAYVYTAVNGDTNESAILSASDKRGYDSFGKSVAINGSKIVVGADTFLGDGSIYLFEKKDDWTTANEDKKFSAIDNLSKPAFGDSVAILNDRIFAGYSAYSSFAFKETILRNVVENSTKVVEINATDADGDTLTYSKSDGGAGVDNDLFNVNSLTGEITFKAQADFENPKDANGDNVYELYVSVRDAEENADYAHVYVRVSDVKYEKKTPRASSYKLKQSLEAQIPVINDDYGDIVAIEGDLMAVLSAKENEGKGLVYLYDKGVKVALLSNDNVEDGDEFGKNILIENDTLYLSASKNENGKIFVYEKGEDNWADMDTPTATITANVSLNAEFAHSLAINNGTLIVGARKDDSRGSAYVFQRPPYGWPDTIDGVKLTAKDGAVNDYFGQDVAISNNTILVGAFQNSAPASDSGAAYIFTKPLSGWVNSSKSAKLTASDASVDDYSAFTVALYNDVAVVSSFRKNANRGQAYVYEKSSTGWSDANETAILSITNLEEEDYFSYSLDIQGDLIAIGAIGAARMGSVYLYDKPDNGWTTTNIADNVLDIPNALVGDFFGTSLELSGDTLVVGSPYLGNVESGEAHIFKGSSTGSLPAIITYLLN